MTHDSTDEDQVGTGGDNVVGHVAVRWGGL
jgi:hypothetical protein